MLPGERFKRWIDGLALEWRDRLRGWMASWIMRGINELMESLEPEGIELARANLSKVLEHPATPQDLKDVINSLLAGKKPLPLLILIPIAALLFIPTITSIFQPLGNLIRYAQERVFHSFRLDPIAVITAWRRDPGKYEGLFSDLRDEGWTEERIEALKFITLFYPSPADLVRWQAREVFEPDMIAKYGLDDELQKIEKEPFYKAGMTDEQITNYWRAHWEHASWMQMVEMLHRGLLEEDDVWEWFRLVEITPYWRDKLIQTAYTWPTRVDVRRFLDMKTIDVARLRELYEGMGYHGKNLDDYVLWTLIYVELPDLLARWKNGWITLDQVRTRLKALGMKADAAEELIQTKVKAVEPASTAEGKELTKAEIYKGVKMGILSSAEGIELIMYLGYTRDQAEYLLVTNVAVLEGSPETYPEFLDMTQKYRKAAGLEGKPVPYALQQAATELVRATKERDDLKRRLEEERKQMIDIEPLPEPAASRIKELQVALSRAESEVARLKADYDAKLAEWKHGG